MLAAISLEYLNAGDPATPEDRLRALSCHEKLEIRCRVAQNPSTPADVLMTLSTALEPEVRAALASNRQLSDEIIEALCRDSHADVRLQLADQIHAPERILHSLIDDENPFVRDRAEQTLELVALERLLQDEDFTPEPGDEARLGELLVAANFLDEAEVRSLTERALAGRMPLGRMLMREGRVTAAVICSALRYQSRVRRGQMSLACAVAALKTLYGNAGAVPRSSRRARSVTAARQSSQTLVAETTLPQPGRTGDSQELWHTEASDRKWQSAQCGIAQVLSDSQSLSDAAPKLLKTVCETAGWDVGVIWEVSRDGARLTFVDFWHVPAIETRNFEEISRNSTFGPGIGLPGRVWNSGQCAWITDAVTDDNFPRARYAQMDGLHGAFAFPIQIQGNVTGVLEFFSREAREPDEQMLASFMAVGNQIGQFIERKMAQNRLREFYAVVASIGSALVQAATLKELLQGCVEALVEHLDAAFARIWTLDESGKCLLLQASAGLYTHIDGPHSRIAVGEFKVGLIASEGRPHLTNNVQGDPRISDKAWARRENMVAFAGHPLMVDGRLVGVMAMFTRHTLAQETIAVLEAIADHVALGIERKRTEEAHARLASIVKNCDDAIISMDSEGVIVHCNRAAEDMYGYSKSEMIGKPISLLVPSNRKSELLDNCNKLRQGKHIDHFETVRRRKDGSLLDVSMTVSPIKSASGNVIGAAALARDISQRKRNELLLSTQHKVTRILADSVLFPDAVHKFLEALTESFRYEFGAFWLFDETSQNLRCVDVWDGGSPRLEEFASVTRHMTFQSGIGMIGKTHGDCVPWWDPQFSSDSSYPRAGVALKAGLHAALAFPIVSGNQVIGVLEFFSEYIPQPERDLLEMMSNVGVQIAQFIQRKDAEERSRKAMQSEQRIAQAVIDRAPAGIARLNASLVITNMNKQFTEQFGPSMDNSLDADCSGLLGKHIFQVLPELPIEKLLETVQKKVPFSIDNFRMPSNSTAGTAQTARFWDLTGWPIDTEDGGMILLTADVTERVRLTQQRDDFVATLTHDLKNPLLGSVRLFGLLLDGHVGTLDARQKKLIKELSVAGQDMLDMIANLLDVYRYDAGQERLHFAAVDIKAVVERCIQQLLMLTNDGAIKIRTEFPQKDNTVSGDELALRRVVMNLVGNAIKFTGGGGAIAVRGRPDGDAYILEVTDTGSGIPGQELELLFERFVQGGTGRRNHSGSGLGLYLSRQIIERHGGSISCQSELGVGTSFSVRLPLQKEAT